MTRMTRLSTLALALLVVLGWPSAGEPADRMYWTDAAVRTIQRANLDGSEVELLVNTGTSPQSLALDVAGGKMYWAEADGMKIRRSNLDGSGVEDLVTGVGPAGIALDVAGGKMYWTDVYLTGWIQRANLDGSAVETVVGFGSDREALTLDLIHGKIYWTNRSWQSIERANLDGSDWEFVIGPWSLLDPRGIALDVTTGKMYWVEIGTHMIRRANLDGTSIEQLVLGLATPSGLALDLAGGRMYWTDFETSDIQRANLDGSGRQQIVGGQVIPVGIALEWGSSVISIDIDIKPGASPNNINLRSSGVIPVALLSSVNFDALEIDPATVTLAGAAVRLVGGGTAHCVSRDANRDGRPDLVCQVETAQFLIQTGDSVAVLEARTFGGQPVRGQDFVRIVH